MRKPNTNPHPASTDACPARPRQSQYWDWPDQTAAGEVEG